MSPRVVGEEIVRDGLVSITQGCAPLHTIHTARAMRNHGEKVAACEEARENAQTDERIGALARAVSTFWSSVCDLRWHARRG